jgi:hypothetical protein
MKQIRLQQLSGILSESNLNETPYIDPIDDGKGRNLDDIIKGITVKDRRREFLLRAMELGATDDAIRTLAKSKKIFARPNGNLSPLRYESLSRGRGWCRLGKGDNVVWAQKGDDGRYIIDMEGRWSLGATDGFSRKETEEWVAKRVKINSTVSWMTLN